MKREMEIYIHIPFCKKKCSYCDFLSFAESREVQKAYVERLCKEIESWNGFDDSCVSTIFIGGGTPSILPAEEIGHIMDTIKKVSMQKEWKEVSIECNPGTIDEEKLLAYREYGINRISFGLQSANNQELKILGRIHTWEEFLKNYELARKAGFANINVDLMSALPGQTRQSYQNTLEKVAQLQPEHISAYSLIIEEGTPFYGKYAEADRKRAEDEPQDLLPSEEEERWMYEDTRVLLKQNGYHRYEISNYAKEGKECRHNCGYWNGTQYKGFGLGAASLLNHVRYQNTGSMKSYFEEKEITEEVQRLTRQDEMEETMILGLRMMKGVNKAEFFKKYGVSAEQIYGKVIKKYTDMGLMENNAEYIRLTNDGISVSNVILSEFL